MKTRLQNQYSIMRTVIFSFLSFAYAYAKYIIAHFSFHEISTTFIFSGWSCSGAVSELHSGGGCCLQEFFHIYFSKWKMCSKWQYRIVWKRMSSWLKQLSSALGMASVPPLPHNSCMMLDKSVKPHFLQVATNFMLLVSGYLNWHFVV